MWEFPEIYLVKISLEDVPSIIIQPTAQNVRESTLFFVAAFTVKEKKTLFIDLANMNFARSKNPRQTEENTTKKLMKCINMISNLLEFL